MDVQNLSRGGDTLVVLENGVRLRARALVIATDAREAARLLGEDVLPETRGTTCFYFAAERPHSRDPIWHSTAKEAG